MPSSLKGTPPTPLERGNIRALRRTPPPAQPGECEWREGLDMHVVLDAESPFRIRHASPDWMRFCGFEASERIEGETLSIVQGWGTQPAQVDAIETLAKTRDEFVSFITNHTASGIPFDQEIRVRKVRDSHGAPRAFHVRTGRACVASGFATPPRLRRGERAGFGNAALPEMEVL